MPGIFSGLKTNVSTLVKLVFLPGEKTRFERNIRRLRNFLLFILISVLLWFVTTQTRLDSSVRAPLLFLRPFWLVLLFWSIVMTYISARKLFHALRHKPAPRLFPEMEENWNYIKKAIAELNVYPRDLPVILVLGHRPLDGPHYFDHLQLRLRNVRLRNDSETLFHVDLTDNAIIVTCQTASLLGSLSRRIELNKNPLHASSSSPKSGLNTNKSRVLGLSGETDQPKPSARQNGGAVDSNLVETNFADLGAFSITPPEIEQISAKLRHLCELIGTDRSPLCPLNSILLVLPKEITDSELLTANAIEMSRLDMKTIRTATGMDLPYAVLGTNLQYTRGFGELVKSLDSNSKLCYLGLALHTRIDITAEMWKQQIRKGMRWFRQSVLPALVIREMLQIPPSAIGAQASGRGRIIESNHTSYRFLQDVVKQWRRLEYFSVRIGQFELDHKTVNPRFAGLFLTGLENNEIGRWLFMHELLKHLLTQQNSVSWTPEALAQNRARRRIAILVLGLLAALFGCLVTLFIWICFR